MIASANGRLSVVQVVLTHIHTLYLVLCLYELYPNMQEIEPIVLTYICQALLDWGANVDAVSFDNDTALMWATYIDHIEIARTLIHAGEVCCLLHKPTNLSTELFVSCAA